MSKRAKETLDTVWTPHGTHEKTLDTVETVLGIQEIIYSIHGCHGIQCFPTRSVRRPDGIQCFLGSF